MKAEPGSIAHNIQTEYAEWFKRLQALTDKALDDREGRADGTTGTHRRKP